MALRDRDPFSEARGRLTGFTAATGKERWRYESPTPMVAGVALTASNLILRVKLAAILMPLMHKRENTPSL